MEWNNIASVELPAGALISDYLTVVGQLEQQAKASLAPRSAHSDAPRVRALAEPVQDALDALLEARDALVAAESRRPTTTALPSSRDTVASNQNADDAFRSLERFLDGARVLPDELVPGRAEAESLYTRLFRPNGLSFLNYQARRQWDAAQRIVAVIEEPEVRECLNALGATRAVNAVLATHREFGLSYGFTQSIPTQLSTTNTRAEQFVLQGALRDYLIKVAAQVSRRRPESATLAAFLLQPYTDLAEQLASAPAPTKRSEPTPPTPSPSPDKPLA